ncbi:HAD-like protein [Lophiostoma macrostomum CBS 122681]|uniref:HAD-like protein n=1 Tax=Lophiostoma macrostomum CBS 122681 TaxID=1314788 RepID=A0A6A6SK97_9PLEO|nr:HAD-like protein [Lophiostoma macrostomum CBS 122681]
MPTNASPSPRCQKAVFFDLMGTCCDWLSSLIPLLRTCPPLPSPSSSPPTSQETLLTNLALSWRAGFFAEIHSRFTLNLPAEDIDITHRRVLDRLLSEQGVGLEHWDSALRDRLVAQWHIQTPWSDVISALQALRQSASKSDSGSDSFFLIVLANGTTRLQLDIAQSSGIPFHMLLSSQLLGFTKPDERVYRKAVELVGLDVDECTMVASHLYDLEAAKGVGMRTIYVRRETEDVGVDFEKERERGYVDFWVEGREKEGGYGFEDVADQLLGDELLRFLP